MGPRSAANVIAAIDQSKNRPLGRLIYALGIRHIGEHAGRILARAFGDLAAVAHAGEDELVALDGIGPEITDATCRVLEAAGVSFAPAALLSVVLIGLLLSEGSGGIPGGGFVIALIYVQAFNLPIEVAAIVGGIYRLVDMGNTTINVMGDLVGTSLVARSEARGTLS